MKKGSVRMLVLLLVLLMAAMQPLTVWAETVPVPVDAVTGTTGDVDWSLDTAAGVMTFSPVEGGTGATANYSGAGKTPWNAYMPQITKLVVEDGVTVLGDRLFYGASNLVEISLPGTLTWVGTGVFRGCSSLKSAVIPGNMTLPSGTAKFGSALFFQDTALESVVLPAGDYSALETVVFSGCTSLKTVTIPANVTEISTTAGKPEKNTFDNCPSLETIHYGGTIAAWAKLLVSDVDACLKKSSITVNCSDGVYVYDDAPQSVVTGETGDVTWSFQDGTGVMTLAPKAGGTGATANYSKAGATPWNEYLTQITKLVVEDGVTVLGDRLFYGASNLVEISLPDTLTWVGTGVFRGCSSLKSAVIPGNMTLPSGTAKFGSALFFQDTALESVVLPAGDYSALETVVFSGCTSLKTVTIPANVTEISTTAGKPEKNTFDNCPSLETIHYGGTVAAWEQLLETDTDGCLQKSSITVFCSDGIYIFDDGTLEPITGETGDVIWTFHPDTGEMVLSPISGGTGITADYASPTGMPWYGYMGNIITVTVENGVVGLGKRLFYGAERLMNVSLPEGLKAIGEGCFRECGSLETIAIPESVESLARVAFWKCPKLENVVLRGSFPSIADKLFQYCASLKELTIPGSVQYIEANAFASCGQLSVIRFGGTVGQWEGVLTHASSAGASSVCKDSIMVYCTDGIYIYGYNSMENGLTYKLENGILTLGGSGAMADYEAGKAPWADQAASVTTVVIPNTITRIGENAFADCKNITKVEYIGEEAQWEALKNASGAGNDPLFNVGMSSGTSGTCGENLTWRFNPATGKLVISGTGAMDDYDKGINAPWGSSLADITQIIVEEGVTGIGTYAFQGARNLASITLAPSVDIIGSYCFGLCVSLTELHIPEGVRVIGAKAFTGCAGVKTVYLPGTLEYVDMKAFDSAVSITDVYYNGTASQWDGVEISMQAQGNKYLVEAALHTLPDGDDPLTDVEAGDWYEDDVRYLVDNGLIPVANGTFRPRDTAELSMILEALYRRAGAPGMYRDAMTWAVENGIVEAGAGETVTLEDLAKLLCAAAAYNGWNVELSPAETGKSAQLLWCDSLGYTDALYANGGYVSGRALNRSEVSSVLAAFLRSETGTTDREADLIAVMKAALAAGGDGKLYILNLDITAPGATAKAGDGALIVFPDGRTMLIDAMHNWGQAKVMDVLERVGLNALDYLVLSHSHVDHYGNIPAIVEMIYSGGGTIGHYYSAGYVYPGSSETAIIELLRGKGVTMHTDVRQGDILTVGDVTIDFFNPSQEFLDAVTASGDYGDENINGVSLAMRFAYGASSFFTSGDLYMSREKALLDQYGGKLQADVMKTNHHGVYTSNSEPWVNTIDPKIMLTQADDIGDARLAARAAAQGREYYAAGLDGLVLVTMDNSANYQVRTQYDSNLRKDFVCHEHTMGQWKDAGDGKTHIHVCGTCGVTESQDHEWDEGVITEEPTETETGVKTYTCEVCGGTKTETIPCKPTEPTEPEVTEPTIPETTEPEVTEPETTEPEVTEPEATEPETTVPETTEDPNAPPQTGDAAPLLLWTLLLAISLAGMAVILWISANKHLIG